MEVRCTVVFHLPEVNCHSWRADLWNQCRCIVSKYKYIPQIVFWSHHPIRALIYNPVDFTIENKTLHFWVSVLGGTQY